MPQARNMKQLNDMLMRSLKNAMKATSKKAEADMYDATGWFYGGGDPRYEPTVYERTGALGDTPRVTENNVNQYANGGEVSFTAYLDNTHVYTTGDNPDMQKVLELANDGTQWITANGKKARLAVGRREFWERAEKNMEKDFEETLSKTFKPV